MDIVNSQMYSNGVVIQEYIDKNQIQEAFYAFENCLEKCKKAAKYSNLLTLIDLSNNNNESKHDVPKAKSIGIHRSGLWFGQRNAWHRDGR